MAYIFLRVPPDAASKLAQIHSTGEVTPLDDMHVTLAFLGNNYSADKVLEAVRVCAGVAASFPAPVMKAALLVSFPENPDYRPGYPVVVRVLSPALHVIQARLCAALDAAGLDYSKRFPTYKPHVTLSHDVTPPRPRSLDLFAWTSGHIMVCGGDKGNGGIFAGLPFA